jgi:Flp pilus assembly pilin Flp
MGQIRGSIHRSGRIVHRLIAAVRSDATAQDMIEYALLAGAVAIVVAAAMPTAVIPAMSNLYSAITSALAAS